MAWNIDLMKYVTAAVNWTGQKENTHFTEFHKFHLADLYNLCGFTKGKLLTLLSSNDQWSGDHWSRLHTRCCHAALIQNVFILDLHLIELDLYRKVHWLQAVGSRCLLAFGRDPGLRPKLRATFWQLLKLFNVPSAMRMTSSVDFVYFVYCQLIPFALELRRCVV